MADGELPPHAERLLRLARGGNEPALGELLEHFRPQLAVLARDNLDRALAGRVSDSDVVQQTCLSAVRDFFDFEGEGVPQFAAWVQAILRRNVLQIVRDHKEAEKRAVSREIPGSAALRETPDRQTSPSQKAIALERDDRLRTVVAGLPDGQREAIALRYLEGLSLSEIAARLGRSEPAVAGLLKRGLARLRELLGAEWPL